MFNSNRAARVRDAVEIPLGKSGSIARFYSFEHLETTCEHVLIAFGSPEGVPLVRIHSECLTGEVFGSLRCDCGLQLNDAIERIGREGGFIVYLRQEGRGIGLYHKLAAYRLQDEGLDTFAANRHLGFEDDLREYSSAAKMLKAVDVSQIRLITNNPDKVRQLEENGVCVRERLDTAVHLTPYNGNYLQAKVVHANHHLKI
jgi:GTP cyclohydrolase II